MALTIADISENDDLVKKLKNYAKTDASFGAYVKKASGLTVADLGGLIDDSTGPDGKTPTPVAEANIKKVRTAIADVKDQLAEDYKGKRTQGHALMIKIFGKNFENTVGDLDWPYDPNDLTSKVKEDPKQFIKDQVSDPYKWMGAAAGLASWYAMSKGGMGYVAAIALAGLAATWLSGHNVGDLFASNDTSGPDAQKTLREQAQDPLHVNNGRVKNDLHFRAS